MKVLPPVPGELRDRARALRREATPAERVLWRRLRARSLGANKVRRQVPLGPYVADFVVASARLVIELDGETHATASGVAHDRRRSAWLRSEGWAVLRFTNADVAGNVDGVLETILAALPRP